jgi:hypothetical protein
MEGRIEAHAPYPPFPESNMKFRAWFLALHSLVVLAAPAAAASASAAAALAAAIESAASTSA